MSNVSERLSRMTLREKVGQTAMPGPNVVRDGVKSCGGYGEYFKQYPFSGFYIDPGLSDRNGDEFSTKEAVIEAIRDVYEKTGMPVLVTCDFEYGAKDMFSDLHRLCSNMSLGAAGSEELAYQRGYYFGRELKSFGVNWVFGPVCDMMPNFFSVSGVRTMSDKPEIITKLSPSLIKGIQASGIAATAKHYPGEKGDYRDSHFSTSTSEMTREEWDASYGKIWKSAIDAGVLSFMSAHCAFPAVDDERVRGRIIRPVTASKKVLDVLRKELGFDGLIVTDAVSMKGITSAFDREDMYIECFNAGNDIVLFTDNDYLDIMERAVSEGRVSMERLDEAVERVLCLKEKLGLFETGVVAESVTEKEKNTFEQVQYEIGKKAITLINNENCLIPLVPEKIKKVTIITLSPWDAFMTELQPMVKAFEDRGIEVTVLERLKSKTLLRELSESQDLIIYACYLAQSRPQGMTCYSRREDISSLFHSLSFGAEKSVVCSFGAPSIYYNYFEAAETYLNAYSCDEGTMRAFADGIMGEFTFTGKSPVELKPRFEK